MESILLIFMRLLAACILSVGAVYLIYSGNQHGWGWCLFCAVILGDMTISNEKHTIKD